MTRLLQMLWVAVAIQIAGEIVDLRWHSTHEDFEGAADQVQAHWLIWLGTALTLAVAAAAARALRPQRNDGLLVVLGAGGIYVAVSVWHFAAHASGTDPDVAHVLLGLTKVAMLGGVVWATVLWRGRRAASSASTIGP